MDDKIKNYKDFGLRFWAMSQRFSKVEKVGKHCSKAPNCQSKT